MSARKVLIATPAYDGRLDVWYVNSLVNTVRLLESNGFEVHPVFLAYDAMIQRARNDLVAIAYEDNFDDMMFIDSDMEWDPAWVLELLMAKEDVIGGTARKKTDNAEMYIVKTQDLSVHANGRIKCSGLGTGFVKLSRAAVVALWDNSPEYRNEGRVRRMVCDVQIVDGELYSEDTVMFKKLSDLGFDCWLNPWMTCAHIGTKKFEGDFVGYLQRLDATRV